jgi:hypothetical protein
MSQYFPISGFLKSSARKKCGVMSIPLSTKQSTDEPLLKVREAKGFLGAKGLREGRGEVNKE